jgi:hypothetical protein
MQPGLVGRENAVPSRRSATSQPLPPEDPDGAMSAHMQCSQLTVRLVMSVATEAGSQMGEPSGLRTQTRRRGGPRSRRTPAARWGSESRGRRRECQRRSRGGGPARRRRRGTSAVWWGDHAVRVGDRQAAASLAALMPGSVSSSRHARARPSAQNSQLCTAFALVGTKPTSAPDRRHCARVPIRGWPRCVTISISDLTLGIRSSRVGRYR